MGTVPYHLISSLETGIPLVTLWGCPTFSCSNTWELVQKAFFAQERECRLATLEGTDRCHAEGLA